MRQHQIHRMYLLLSVVLLLIASLVAVVIPISAQDGAFATNTPVGEGSDSNDASSPMVFATNTPAGSASDVASEVTISTAPQAPLFNYGMRFWLEEDFVTMVLNQVEMLEVGDDDAQLAVNFLLYEMEQRFPSSPTQPEQRLQLISAMINAPLGSLDMRSIMRPFIQSEIDANPSEFLIEAEGFQIALTPANLDGEGEFDRMVNVSYVTDDITRYEEYLLAIANDSGSYTLLPLSYELPAVPFAGIESVSMEFLRDVNADTLDELVLRVNDSGESDRFLIIEYRNGNAVDLVDPAQQLRVGEIINWSVDTASNNAPPLIIFEYQSVSAYPDWECLNQIEYTWQYERNLYRRSQDLNAQFRNVDSLGCTLANADLFNMPVPEAITTIESALLEYGFDAPSTNRALMTLSVFYVLSGRLDDARNTAQSIITVDDDSTWESRQANALIRATSASGNTALDICEAIAMADEFPACDMSAVIDGFLDVMSLSTDMDLIEELESVGFTVLESVSISEIGRANRTVVLFQYFDSGWWGFYEGSDDFYQFEESEAPIGFEEASFPQGQIQAPQTAIDALLLENDPARVLAVLDNLTSASSDIPFAPSALYMQALAYEFTGDRDNARAVYYELWERYETSIWGQISSPHLELR